MGELIRTALSLDQDLAEGFNRWMAAHGYHNRSEAIRDLMRSALVEAEWDDPEATVVAALSIIYDHESRSLAQELTHIQHADHHAVLCSQHVHLDAHRCLEVVVLKGLAGQIRRLADTIVATRGVRAGKLTLMSPKV